MQLLERPNEQAVPSIWVMEGGYGANGGAAGPLARTHQDAVSQVVYLLIYSLDKSLQLRPADQVLESCAARCSNLRSRACAYEG